MDTFFFWRFFNVKYTCANEKLVLLTFSQLWNERKKLMPKIKLKKIITKLAVLLILGQSFGGSLTALATASDSDNQTEVSATVKEEKQEEQDKVPENKETDKPIGESKEETTIEAPVNENARAKASPEVIENDQLETLTVGQDGKIYYKGEVLYVGANGEQIPANLNELMKKGVSQELSTRTKRSVKASVGIQYNGQVSYGGTTVGDFTVNGKTAFCLQHPKPTPPSGTQGEMAPHNNINMQRILYYGWEGPQNIFGSDRARGIVVTSLVLSKYYNGDISGTSIPGWKELDNLAQNGSVPDNQIQINQSNGLVDLSVSLINGKQISKQGTLNADKANSVTANIPNEITFVNETTGEKVTNGNVTIYGGQTFHLEADARTTYNYNSGLKNGTVKAFQPLVIRPADSGLQDIGTWQWYDDPAQVVSFKADFFARLGDVNLVKEDSETGTTPQGDASLNGAVYRITDSVGTVKDVTIENNKATAKDLLIGEVTIQEIKAPIGYQLDPTMYTATLDYNATTGKIEVTRTVKENVIKGNVIIMKFFAVNEGSSMLKPEKGAGFSIYLKSTGELKQYQLTGDDGIINFKDLPFGTYTVKQTVAPEGSLKVADFEVEVTEQGKTYTYSILNDKFMSPLRITKVDSETGKNVLVPGTVFKIKNVDTGLWVSQTTHNITEFVTDKTGEVLLYDQLRFGNYELYEIKAPDGYVINKKPLPFKVSEETQNEGVITIKFDNKAQKGKVELHKTGDVATDSKSKDTDFGKLYEFVYSQKGLAGAEFDVKAAEDIVTGDGTVRVRKGEVAGHGVTNAKGDLVVSDLYLGKYVAVETKAPAGMVLDGKEIPFELTYAGQNVEITSTSVKAENKLQDLVIKIHKTDEKVIKWENGQPITEQVPSDGKVFGVFTGQQFGYNDKVIIPQDALIGLATTKEGIAAVQEKYPEGKFYVKELDAGDNHVINPNKFAFEFTAKDNNKTLEIGIWGDSVAYGKQNLLKIARNPITNELAKQDVELVKVDNETEATEIPLVNVPFKFLQVGSDGKEEVIGEYKTDETGKINVNGLPVGEYKFTEGNPLEGYLPLGDDISFSVTLDGNGKKIVLKAINKRIKPELRTKATGINGQKVVDPLKEIELVDTITYKNLIPGKEYEVITKAVDVITGEVIVSNTSNYTPQTANGTYDVHVKVDGSKLAGRSIVFYEYFNRKVGEEVKEEAKHEDKNDKDQTVRFTEPTIHTMATGENGKHEVAPNKDVKIKDTVYLDGLVPGQTYTVDGWAVDQATGKEIAGVKNAKTFVATDSKMTIELEFTVNGSQLQGRSIVFYEKLSTQDQVIARHENINDKDQTIRILKALPQTGEQIGNGLIILGVSLVVLGSVFIYFRKKDTKKEV